MALLKVICWAIIFITRLRFPPGKSLASMYIMYIKSSSVCRIKKDFRKVNLE